MESQLILSENQTIDLSEIYIFYELVTPNLQMSVGDNDRFFGTDVRV